MVFFKKITDKLNIHLIFNLLTTIALLILPYFIFGGKLFAGGDDSKLIYIYPNLFLRNITYFSWFNFSIVSINNPAQFLLPFAFFWSILDSLLGSKIILDYSSFSLPLILGFYFFQKVFSEIIHDSHKYTTEIYLGSLFYILSPILIVSQFSSFYNSVWLIGLIPIICFYFLRYLKTSHPIYLFGNIIWCTIFSLGLFSIPWLIGFVLPIMIGLIIIFPLLDKRIIYIRRAMVFAVTLLLSQSFYLLSFFIAYLNVGKNNVGEGIFSGSIANSFRETVLSTASGNIFYPLLNLYHKQISIDFGWGLEHIYLYYDKILLLNIILVILILLGIFKAQKTLTKNESLAYFIILISFVISLFLFTVNIGPLKDVFLLLGHIPGFFIFRNFYDKFALGYVILYSSSITFSIIIVNKNYPKIKLYIYFLAILIIFMNAIPIRNIINRPIWTTTNIYGTVLFPNEYINFINEVKYKIQPTTNILSFPFNKAAYSIITENNSSNAFVGTSPLKILTGINDITGDISLVRSKDAERLNSYIKNKDYKKINSLLEEFNINYIMVTHNIPNEIKQSYLFDQKSIASQDQNLIKAITNKAIIKSSNGNYVLYSVLNKFPILSMDNIKYQKVNPVMYKISIHNFKGQKKLTFRDSYSAGWKMYFNNTNTDLCNKGDVFNNNITECPSDNKLLNIDEFGLFLQKNIFDTSNKFSTNQRDVWLLDEKYIKNNYPGKFSENKDGSINFQIILYFKPQQYFYIGTLITALTFIFTFVYLVTYKYYEKRS